MRVMQPGASSEQQAIESEISDDDDDDDVADFEDNLDEKIQHSLGLVTPKSDTSLANSSQRLGVEPKPMNSASHSRPSTFPVSEMTEESKDDRLQRNLFGG